ncbi:hypothetical protein [Streptomyces chartreusis]|uniref:hypothetical protein n=1 Tax=Streptomyces chartreusis TaxID=1969 RepID=UPI002F91440B|nr:hypothetical protein OG938_44520 [Streptomyces chartreusis]
MTRLAVNYGTEIDWGNPGFIEIYSYAFGVSTILTVILWLLAVAKRAAQGVHFGQALSESIGYLLMSVMVSAFAPAAVAYAVQLMDGAAEAMLDSQSVKIAVLGTIVVGCLLLLAGTGIGAPLALIIGFGLILILLAIWLLLVVRNALILCGLVFGPTVFSGLVNKDLWQHTRRWAGVMVAIISAKYVIYTVLALAIALTEDLPKNVADLSFGQALGTLMTVFALFFLALFAPFQIGRFVPIFGDEMQAILQSRGTVMSQAKSAFNEGKSLAQGLAAADNPRLGGTPDVGEAEAGASAGGGSPQPPNSAGGAPDRDTADEGDLYGRRPGVGGEPPGGSGDDGASAAPAPSTAEPTDGTTPGPPSSPGPWASHGPSPAGPRPPSPQPPPADYRRDPDPLDEEE